MAAGVEEIGGWSEEHRSQRQAPRHGTGRRAAPGVLGAAAGGPLASLLAEAAAAAPSEDVQTLQTAASLENLALNTYRAVLTLPYIGGATANPVVKAFCEETARQHDHHLDGYNTAARRLGGEAQHREDPTYVPVVRGAVARLQGATATAGVAAVLDLALELEDVAAQTYVENVARLSDSGARQLTASIMGVEAQHAAVLRSLRVLVQSGMEGAIALRSSTLRDLAPSAVRAALPGAFYPTSRAAPPAQGAVPPSQTTVP